jgi:beta-aspartyl-peptidase (threonine type)
MQLVVHGGAGSVPANPGQRQRVIDRAAAAGAANTEPLTAAVTAVRVLEADPRFNAGVGSAVQSDGVVRTDAGLMTGDGRTGAACSMPGVEHAAGVARLVAEETPHVLVSGQQAVDLAEAFDIPTGVDLWSSETRQRWDDLSAPGEDTRDQLEFVREQFGGIDTVGAVAADGDGVATVTSTGGRWCALAGRVGDVPQIGAGFYASEHAAASATGAGEAIARFGLARRVVDAIEDGDDPKTATDRTIRGFGAETGAEAGVIAVDIDGRTGSAFNSDGMQTAVSEP